MRKSLLVIVALILLVPVAILAVFIYTPLGVSLVAGQLYRFEKSGILIEGLSGQFSEHVFVERFELNHPRVHVVAHDIRIEPKLRALLVQTLSARSFSASNVEVQVRDADMPPPDRPPRFLPSFLRIAIANAQLDRVRYEHLDGRTIEAHRIEGAINISHHRLRVNGFNVDADRFDAGGNLTLVAARPLKIELNTEGSVLLQPDLMVTLGAKLGGDIERMTISADIREPSPISAEGLFTRDLQGWRIVGKLSSPTFALEPWLEQPPFSFRNIALDVEVTREQIHARGNFTIPEYNLSQIGIDARGRFSDRVLYVQDSEFTVPGSPSRVHANGTLTFAGGPPNLELATRWTDLQWPLRQDAVIYSRVGQATLRGTLPYTFDMNAQIDGPDIPNAVGVAQGVLSKEDVVLHSYDLNTLEGSIAGSGRIEFEQPRIWSLTANAKQINPVELHASLPGRITFNAIGAGKGIDKNADFRVAAHNLHGTLREQTVRGSGEIERSARRWQVRDAELEWGAARLALDAKLHDTIELTWSLNTPALDKLIPNASGSIDFSGSAQGKRDTPRVTAHLAGERLSYREWSAQSLAIEGDVDSSNAQPSRLTVSARRAGYGARLAESVDASGHGTALDHRIGVNVVGMSEDASAAPRARLEVSGKLEEEVWTASIATTQFSRGNPPQEVKIAEPASATLSRERAMLDNFCLVIAAGRLCAEGRWQRDGSWEAEVSGYEIPLATVLPESEEDVEYAGRIEGSARFFGSDSAVWQGEAGMKISDAAIIYRPQGSEPETLNLGTGGMHLVAKPEQIDFSFGVQAFTDTYLHTNAQLTRSGEANVLRLPLRGEIRARAADANLLPLLFPEVDHAAGVLSGSANIGGTLSQPEIDGRIELANGELDSYRANFALRDLDLIAEIASNRLEFRGNGNAGEGRLEVTGDLRWNNAEPRGRMQLRGTDLLVADLPEYRIVASPDLQFEIDATQVRVQGDVTIPSALVQPAKLSGAVGPSNDARYVGEHAAEQEGRLKVHSEVRVHMGEDVRVDAFGLHGRIEGAVTTNVRTGEVTTGHGELRVAEGRYEAYGQELEINRGQLIFDNAPLDDPGLDIEARRRVETVTVGLNVRGTLQAPRLTFFSDPSMPQTQIVSYLLIGKPLNATAAADSENMTAASDTLALQGGGFLASQLGRRLGLEEVGVENYINSAGEANPSLVLGKFLSPRLFISYGISLTESINTLKLRYTISDRWILRTESGEAQSADLEYMIER